MSKLIALYVNEMTKIWRKISSIILISIMILGVIGFGGLMKLQESMNNNRNEDFQTSYIKESMEAQLNDAKMRLADVEAKLKVATAEEALSLEQEKVSLTAQIESYSLAISKNINIYSNDFRARALNSIISLKSEQSQYKIIPIEMQTQEIKNKILDNNALIARYEKVIDNKDFKEYINIKNDEIKSSTTLSEDEKKISLESNELMLKYNLTGKEDNNDPYQAQASATIAQIENYKRALATNMDTSTQYPKPMTNELREKAKNDLAIALYKLDKGITSTLYGANFKEIAMQGMLGFGLFMIIILMLILAGGSISGEMSTGSIKSLIISPTKRWKIFTAKVLSLLTVGVVAAIILYVIAILTSGVLFGFGAGSPYIYATNGVAHELNFYIYKFAYIFVNFLDVIVYMSLAFMLSVITRNTAASVGISIAIYFGGSIANSFISYFAKGEWIKFIPFNNLSLATKIFEYDSLQGAMSSGMGGISTILRIPISFSLCYIAVIVICMGYTALDSFNRRDIK